MILSDFEWSMLAFALLCVILILGALGVSWGGSRVTPSPVPMKGGDNMANDINVGELTHRVIQININDGCFLNLSKEEAKDLMCQLAIALDYELVRLGKEG